MVCLLRLWYKISEVTRTVWSVILCFRKLLLMLKLFKIFYTSSIATKTQNQDCYKYKKGLQKLKPNTGITFGHHYIVITTVRWKIKNIISINYNSIFYFFLSIFLYRLMATLWIQTVAQITWLYLRKREEKHANH